MTKERDENHADYVGNCEFCGKQMFVGDCGLYYSSGEVVCAAPDCAPTWASSKLDWELPDAIADNPEGAASFQTAYQKHVADGGKPEDIHFQIL